MNYQIPTSTGGVWYDGVMSAVHRLSSGKSIFITLGGARDWTYLVQPINGAGDDVLEQFLAFSTGAIGLCVRAEAMLPGWVALDGVAAGASAPESTDAPLPLLSSVAYFARENADAAGAAASDAGATIDAAGTDAAGTVTASDAGVAIDAAGTDAAGTVTATKAGALPAASSAALTALRAMTAGDNSSCREALRSLAKNEYAIDLVLADAGGVLSCPTPVESAFALMDAAKLSGSFLIRKVSADEADINEADAGHANAVYVSVEDVLAFKCADTKLTPVIGRSGVPMPTAHGLFAIHAFHDAVSGLEHVALTVGDLTTSEPVLTRLHSECLTGDVFSSQRCDCGEQLETSLHRLAEAGRGVLIYLRQEGRGIGLANKLKAYELQDRGFDTADANLQLGLPIDARNFALAAMVLAQLKVSKVRLITNNPAKIDVLQRNGVDVVEREMLQAAACRHNDFYLRTKRDRLGHLLGV